MGENLTESEMIDRELLHVRAMSGSPYRKGIIAGLLHRQRSEHDPCPAQYRERAARNWRDGFNSGVTRDLRRWDERQPTTGRQE